MRLPRPRSLAAQMALLLGIALLVAQLANFALILNERQKLSLAQIEGPAINRFADIAADLARADPSFGRLIVVDASRPGARFRVQAGTVVHDAIRDAAVERRLRSALTERNLPLSDVRAGTATRQRAGPRGRTRDTQFLILSVRQPDGRWLNGRIVTPRRDPWLVGRLGAATLLLYLIVLGATVWLAWRIARPLRDLTLAANSFGGRSPAAPVRPRGPDDLRRAIEAFNAMNVRLLALLDEKDRMLGAIGHDLRTPLASLRIRVEGLEPEEERAAAVAKIEEMTAMLQNILDLARSGRARDDARPTDITALVETVVEEFRELGRDVTLLDSGRHVAPVAAGLLKRAVGNLIDNAVKYGGSARVTVTAAVAGIEIRVADDGPGIPEAERERVFEAFYRIEESRNRATGGSGLGLAIARSIAEGQGGTLVLRAGEPRGVVAVLTLPA
jgi:signal transduction histidine kinase